MSKMFGTNTAYNFVDKDPICGILASICKPFRLQDVADKSGVHVNTLWGIFYGPTISPRYCTVARIVKGLGVVIGIGETRLAREERSRTSRTVRDIMAKAARAAKALEKSS